MTNDLTYKDYLRVDTLLSLQEPLAALSGGMQSTVLAEHFFIISHQTCELWLKQILADLAAVARTFRDMDTVELEWSVDLLYRAGELLRLLHEQVVALERLPLHDFARFRELLGTASGAQSTQFRELDRMIGDNRRSGTLYLALRDGLAARGSSVEEVCDAGVSAGSTHRLVEALLFVGNGYWRWKIAHVGLITKMLGGLEGTAGSSGAAYLLDRASLPFGELRELRSRVHRPASRHPDGSPP